MEMSVDNPISSFFEAQNQGRFAEYKRTAWEAFSQKGWPSRKDEEYKFTPIDQLLKRNFSFEEVGNDLSLSKQDVASHFYEIKGHHLVFLNGVYRKELSEHAEDAITIKGFSELGDTQVKEMLDKCKDDRASVLVNRAFTSNGLSIKAEQPEALPIFIYHFRGGQMNSLNFPCIDIETVPNSHLKVYEKSVIVGNTLNLSSHLTTISVAKHASVRFTKIQDYNKTDFTLDNLFVDQEEESHFYANTFSFSGGLIRNNLEIAINGEHSEANMYGLFLLDGKSHVDNHTVVDHRYPNCDSNELYKGIVDENATGVFNGKIFVRQAAQKTNAFQSNNNISLSDTANIHTKPQLEIWADDVKCSHGCTVGQLDEEALFYLQSRGIRPQSAKAMMLNAFAKESLNHVQLDLINQEITDLIHARLDV